MTSFEELLAIRRSVRDFKDQPVPLDLVRTLIAECTLAPNASNEQPWQFVVVRDQAYMKRISDESKKNLLVSVETDPQSAIARYAPVLRDPSFNVFYNAPCLVIIAGHEERASLAVDCALAAGYLMMAAASRGLGTCWINLGAHIVDDGLRAELGLKEGIRVIAPIILGYPKRVPSVPARKPPQILAVIDG